MRMKTRFHIEPWVKKMVYSFLKADGVRTHLSVAQVFKNKKEEGLRFILTDGRFGRLVAGETEFSNIIWGTK